jgi:TatD DNase family protein
MLFDTHCHIDDEAYQDDREAMIDRAFATGMQYMVCPGVTVESSRQAIALAHRYEQVYAAVGIHPEDGATATKEGFDQLELWLKNEPKIVAVGEIGLDYYWPEPSREIQHSILQRQLAMAKQFNKPIIIHDRDAHGDILQTLKDYGQGLGGIIHCYSGSYEMAKELLKLGYYLGFGGTLVFPKSKKQKEMITRLPMERIVIETDSPYLTPPPYRGKRNEPAYVRYVAEEIARLRGMSVEEVQHITLENGKTVFGIR